MDKHQHPTSTSRMPSPYKERPRIHACPVEDCDFAAVYPKDLQKHVAKGQAERDKMGEGYELTECKDCGKKWCTRGCKPKHQCGRDEEEVDEEEERQWRRSKYLEEFNKKFGQRIADPDTSRSYMYQEQSGERKTKLTVEEQAEFVREFNKRYGHRNAAGGDRVVAQRSAPSSGMPGPDIDTIIDEQIEHEVARGLRARNGRQDMAQGKAVFSAEQTQAFVREFNARFGHQNARDGDDEEELAPGLNVNHRGQGAGHTQSSPQHALDDINAIIAARRHDEFVRAFYARHRQHASSATTTPPQQKPHRARQSLNVTGIDGSGLLADPFVDQPLPSSNTSAPATPSQPSSSRRRKREAEDEPSYSGVPYEQRKFLCPNTPCEYAANKKHTMEGHQKAGLKETSQREGRTHVTCTRCPKQFCTFSAARRHDCDAAQAPFEQAGAVVENEVAPETSSSNDRRRPISMSDAATSQYTHSSPSPTKPPMDQHHHQAHPIPIPHLRSPSPYIKPERTPEPPLPGPDRVFPSTSTHKPLALGPSSDTGHWVYDALEKDYPLLSSELMAQMVYSVEMGPHQYVWPSDVVYLRKLPRLADLGKNIHLVWEEGEFDENRRSERDVLIRGRLRHWGMEKEQVRMKGELVKEKGWQEEEAEEFVWGEQFVAGLYERAHRGELDPSVQEAEEWFAEEVRGHEESGKQATK